MHFNYSKSKLILIFLFILSIDLYAQREEIELASDGWKIWMDQDAAWEMDTLYLPSEITDIDVLPHPAPSVGWDAMYETKGLSCTVPGTVEEFFSGGVNTWRYHGVRWFWKSFEIPSSWSGKKIPNQKGLDQGYHFTGQRGKPPGPAQSRLGTLFN